ncbi:MAG: aconitate hydratase B, partial [Acidobacteriota bacterium]
MIDDYLTHEAERRKMGIPPLPLSPELTEEVCRILENPPDDKKNFFLDLLSERISPGVDPAAEVKARWLLQAALGEKKSPFVSPSTAVSLLGTMLGGYNVDPLLRLLESGPLQEDAAAALKHIILVYGAFDTVFAMAKKNPEAMSIIQSWAKGGWFLTRPAFPDKITVRVFKIEGETNTDDFSPAKHAWSRPDIPLHALSMGEMRFPGGIGTIAGFRKRDEVVAFVGDVVGTGSSRKSATNSMLWHIGRNIPHVPNKRRGGVVIGGLIAPIFFNTVEDSGGLPLLCDVTGIKDGQLVTLDFKSGTIRNEAGADICSLDVKPATLKDEYRAGGRLNLIIGRQLTARARKALGLPEADFFHAVDNPRPKKDQGYSLAQKIVGKGCGVTGVMPGSAVLPKMTTVGSQDTTGPMTADELKELACLEFQTELFMQSFCHTAAYPKAADVKMHQSLPPFMTARKGVVLKPGDGIIHSWLN